MASICWKPAASCHDHADMGAATMLSRCRNHVVHGVRCCNHGVQMLEPWRPDTGADQAPTAALATHVGAPDANRETTTTTRGACGEGQPFFRERWRGACVSCVRKRTARKESDNVPRGGEHNQTVSVDAIRQPCDDRSKFERIDRCLASSNRLKGYLSIKAHLRMKNELVFSDRSLPPLATTLTGSCLKKNSDRLQLV